MKVKPMLGSFALDDIIRIESSESRALVEHHIPGLAGSYFQDMGTVPNTIVIVGTKYGDEERDDFLKGIREIFNKGEPTTFVADINTATDITDVLVEDLDVAEIGGSPDTFCYKIKVRKYTKPPEPPSTGILGDGILDDALNLVDTAMNAIDMLGSIPNLGNPTEPLRKAIDGVKTATSGIDAISNDLNNLFFQETEKPPAEGTTETPLKGGALETPLVGVTTESPSTGETAEVGPTGGSKETPAVEEAGEKASVEGAEETMPAGEMPIEPMNIPPEAWDALESLYQTLGVSDDDKYELGVGIKRVAGKFVNNLALIVYVPEKKPPEEVPPSQLVPPMFKGFPTDVIENRIILTADKTRYNTLCGGIEISTPEESEGIEEGTLGVVVRRRTDGHKLLLTCEHVVSNEGTKPWLSREIYQPSLSLGGGIKNPESSVIGKCVAVSTKLDAAIIDPDFSSPPRSVSNNIKGIGPVRGSRKIEDELGPHVKKRGKTTGLTNGWICALKGPHGDPNQIEISPFEFYGSFSQFCDKGDSGSAVLNDQNEVIALLLAKLCTGYENYYCPTSLAVRIEPILEALDIDIAIGPVIYSITPNYWDSTLGPVKIEGFGFESPNQVYFGDDPGQVQQETPTHIEVIPPPMADKALVNVRVRNKWQDDSEEGPESMFEYRDDQGSTPSATPRELTYTTADVIDERISVPAQHSLVRLSKNPDTSADAVGMLEEVKADRLAGIYCVNWEKSAKRAIKLGSNWWTVIPDGEDSVLMLDPDDLEAGPPMISFRRGLDPDCGGEETSASPSRIDAALIRVWQAYLGFRNGKIRPGPCPYSAPSSTDEPMQIQPENVAPPCCATPPIICQPGSFSGNLDAAVDELKTKVNDCKIVEMGTNLDPVKHDCRRSVDVMRALLRSRNAFPGCRRTQNILVATNIHLSIQKDANPARCCVVQYKKDLGVVIEKLRKSLDDGFLIKTGVLAGVCTYTGGSCENEDCCVERDPDHWILIIGHDGGNKFVFWDPNGHLSNATTYCRGFGYLFYDANIPRFSTAENDSEMDVDSSGRHTSAKRAPTIRLRCCLKDPKTNLPIPDCCHEPGNPQARFQVLQLIAY